MDHFRPSRPQPAEEPNLKQILVCEKHEEHSPSTVLCSRNIFGEILCSMARRRRSGSPSAMSQAVDDGNAYNSTTNPETWSTVVLAKDNAAHMQVLDSLPSKAQDHQSSITTEAKLLSAHSLVSGVSLNKKLAIAISVPICFFVLLAVVAVAIYCSRLHRPHRKEASRRGSEHQREDAPQDTTEAQDQQRSAALAENGTQPDIKAILEALKSPKDRSESGPTPLVQAQDKSQQDEQPSRTSADLSPWRDSSSDGEGTHFSDLEDPFIDRPADTPGRNSSLRDPETADSSAQSLVEDASHPSQPPPPLEELEDPFVDAGENSTIAPIQEAANPDQKVRQRDEFADDPGLWLKPVRKIDSAHGASRQEVQDEEVQYDLVSNNRRTTPDSHEAQANIENVGEPQEASNEAQRLKTPEDPPQDLERSSHNQPDSDSPSTVIDDAYTTPRSEGAEVAKGGDTYTSEPAREAKGLDEQPEAELPEQNSVDQVDDDLVSHIEAVEMSRRDSPGHDPSDSNIEPPGQDLAATTPHSVGEDRNTLLGNDLTKTARSRSFAGHEGDGEDNILRRTISR